MKQATGDLFALARGAVLVITTNGTLRADGKAVMGRGCAAQAAARWPFLAKDVGDTIRRAGNVMFAYQPDPVYKAVVTMPVKHNWWESADTGLIAKFAAELVKRADECGWSQVFMPRPGCGNGRLEWELIRKIIQPILDDRFTVVSFK